jgi:hypothetical protein
MKFKHLLTKTLLVAVGLLGGVNLAWGDVPTYTWDFTNLTTWTTAKVSTGSAVTLNPSGATPGAGEYGVTFNFTSEKGQVKWNAASKAVSGTGLWFYAKGSASAECVSITVPAGFKVTFNFIGGNLSSNGRPFKSSTDGGENINTLTSSPYQYTNETASDVTVTMWTSNCLNNNNVSQNCINSIVLEDYSVVAKHTWSAKAYATISGVKTEIDSWNAGGAEYSESEEYNVWAKKVITYGGHYYELDDAKFAANAVYFSTTMGDADAEHEITYTLNDDIAFYTECEDWYATQHTNSLIASNGVYVNYYNGTHNVTITDAGVYKMETNVLSRGGDSGLRVYDSSDNELAGFYRAGTGFKQTDAFYVAADYTIKVGMLNANTAGIDYILIRKINEAADAIAYCKTAETSSDFATYIDAQYAAGSLLTAAQVYAAYNTWEVEQAVAASSTDYTKVILNADFGTNNLTPWAIFGNAAAGDTDNNSYGVIEDNGNGGYQYYTGWNGRNVSQTITGLPAGVYRLTAKIYSWSGGAPVRLFANGTLSAEENGENHEISLEFTVTGSESGIKIGVGGVGNNNDTDNTWGTWGYRIDYFTLTKIASVSKSITSAGWATYCSPYALDLENATGLEDAYIVTGGENGVLTKTSVKSGTVPANTGLLLKGSEGTATIPVVGSSATSVTDNILEGVTVDTPIAAEAGWVLMASPSLGFYQNGAAFTVGANTAYIPVAKLAVPASARAFFSLDDETNGINAVATDVMNGKYYNLSGQRVAAPQKGLYIVNGKKVVVK